MKTLSHAEIMASLEMLPEWTPEDGALRWQERFPNFSAAFAFLTRVALLAEKAAHHPDVTLMYNLLTLRLVSHKEGGITTRDLDMAAAIGYRRVGRTLAAA